MTDHPAPIMGVSHIEFEAVAAPLEREFKRRQRIVGWKVLLSQGPKDAAPRMALPTMPKQQWTSMPSGVRHKLLVEIEIAQRFAGVGRLFCLLDRFLELLLQQAR